MILYESSIILSRYYTIAPLLNGKSAKVPWVVESRRSRSIAGRCPNHCFQWLVGRNATETLDRATCSTNDLPHALGEWLRHG